MQYKVIVYLRSPDMMSGSCVLMSSLWDQFICLYMIEQHEVGAKILAFKVWLSAVTVSIAVMPRVEWQQSFLTWFVFRCLVFIWNRGVLGFFFYPLVRNCCYGKQPHPDFAGAHNCHDLSWPVTEAQVGHQTYVLYIHLLKWTHNLWTKPLLCSEPRLPRYICSVFKDNFWHMILFLEMLHISNDIAAQSLKIIFYPWKYSMLSQHLTSN